MSYRFPERPFFVKLFGSYLNPGDQVKADGTGTTEQETIRHALRARSFLPPVYLDEKLEASVFFSKIEVIINDVKIDIQSLDEWTYIFQAINHIYCSDELSKRKYGKKLTKISSSEDRLQANANNMTPTAKAVSRSLQFRNWNTNVPNLIRFGIEGVWPFSSQVNALRTIMNQHVPNGYLRPLTTIELRLHRRLPMESMLETFTIRDQFRFEGATKEDVPDLITKYLKDIKFKMTDLTIVYESYTPDHRELATFMRGPSKYWVDVPKFRIMSVPPGMSYVNQVMDIPAKTKILFFGWLHTYQLWHEEGSFKNLNTHFRFIPNAINLKFRMPGKEAMFFADGFQNIGTPEALMASNWASVYHDDMVSRGLWSEVFDDVFPELTTKYSYKQVLLLDLTDFNFDEDFQLEVTTTFNAALSPPNYYMFYISVQQYAFNQTENKLTFELPKS
jgi:hypothetical protein